MSSECVAQRRRFWQTIPRSTIAAAPDGAGTSTISKVLFVQITKGDPPLAVDHCPNGVFPPVTSDSCDQTNW